MFAFEGGQKRPLPQPNNRVPLTTLRELHCRSRKPTGTSLVYMPRTAADTAWSAAQSTWAAQGTNAGMSSSLPMLGTLDRCLEALRVAITATDAEGWLVAETAVDDYIAAAGPDKPSKTAALRELDRSVREAIPEPASSQILSFVESRRRSIEKP
jgi:hypothetical protein